MDKRPSPRLDLSDLAQAALIEGAHDLQPVTGLTHNFYRYPARFSPAFVRAAIEAFTEPGDYVLDPYMGGGTSLVEAVAVGLHARSQATMRIRMSRSLSALAIRIIP
jgi:DNA methylase